MQLTQTQANAIRQSAARCLNVFGAYWDVRIEANKLVLECDAGHTQHGNLLDSRSLSNLQTYIQQHIGTDTGTLWVGFNNGMFQLWTSINN